MERDQGRIPIYIRNVWERLRRTSPYAPLGSGLFMKGDDTPNCAISGRVQKWSQPDPHETRPMFVYPRREWRPMTCLYILKPEFLGLRLEGKPQSTHFGKAVVAKGRKDG